MFKPILSDEDCKALASFKYKGAPDTMLEGWILQPFWRWSAKFVPIWISPNAITFLGWGVMMIATSVLMYTSVMSEELAGLDFSKIKKNGPLHNFLVNNTEEGGFWRSCINPMLDFENEVSAPRFEYSWAFFLTAFAMKFYLTMDNIDGKHARRLGFSSALGSVIDHGVDCTTCIMFALMVMFGCDIKGKIAASPIGFIVYMFGIQTPFYLAQVESAFKGNLDPAGASEGVIASMIVPLGTAIMGDHFWAENGAALLLLMMGWIGFSVAIQTSFRLWWRHGYVQCATWWIAHILISGKMFFNGAAQEHTLLTVCLIGMNFILISGSLVVRNLVSFSEDKFVDGKFVAGRNTGLWDNAIEYQSCLVLLIASLCYQLLPTRELRLGGMLFVLALQVVSFFYHSYTALTGISRNLDFPIIALPKNPKFAIGQPKKQEKETKSSSSDSPRCDLLNDNDDLKKSAAGVVTTASGNKSVEERKTSSATSTKSSNSTTDNGEDSRSASSIESNENSPNIKENCFETKIDDDSSPMNIRQRTAVIA